MAKKPPEFVEELLPEKGRLYAKCYSCNLWCDNGHTTREGAERLAMYLSWRIDDHGWICKSCDNSEG